MKIRLKKINNLKNCSIKEISEWVSWLNDKIVTKFSEQRFQKHSSSTQKKFIKNKIKTKKTLLFKIYYKKEFVGVIELGNIDHTHFNCEIMYFIGKREYWSKGIATKAIKLSIIEAKKIKIKKVYAGVYSNNLSSIRVLIKNKFKIEGKLSNFFTFKRNLRVKKIILGLSLKN